MIVAYQDVKITIFRCIFWKCVRKCKWWRELRLDSEVEWGGIANILAARLGGHRVQDRQALGPIPMVNALFYGLLRWGDGNAYPHLYPPFGW